MSQIEQIEVAWKETQPLTADEVRLLLTRPDTVGSIRQSLHRTNREGHKFMGKLLGQEFGFAAFGDLSSYARRIHVSPLFEGQEGSLDLYEQSQQYLQNNQTLPTAEVFYFHTHTYLLLEFLKEIGERQALETDERELDYFTIRDFRAYFYQTRIQPFLIFSLGTERNNSSQVLLISFNSFEACRDFEYKGVHQRSLDCIKVGTDPLDIYREAGLNTATIRVNLTSQPVLDRDDIDKASLTLAQRR